MLQLLPWPPAAQAHQDPPSVLAGRGVPAAHQRLGLLTRRAPRSLPCHQIQQGVLVPVAQGAQGGLAVQRVQGLLPGRCPRERQQDRGLPCSPYVLGCLLHPGCLSAPSFLGDPLFLEGLGVPGGQETRGDPRAQAHQEGRRVLGRQNCSPQSGLARRAGLGHRGVRGVRGSLEDPAGPPDRHRSQIPPCQ